MECEEIDIKNWVEKYKNTPAPYMKDFIDNIVKNSDVKLVTIIKSRQPMITTLLNHKAKYYCQENK